MMEPLAQYPVVKVVFAHALPCPLRPQEERERVLTVRISETTYNAISDAARKAGVSMNKFARSKLIAEVPCLKIVEPEPATWRRLSEQARRDVEKAYETAAKPQPPAPNCQLP